ncbi:heat-inducible transcriptional repressor HrcA [Hwanghaeella sp.]|uniref:heat-inducible transcriptional repressor HrcA n=1 Tax=Hwanghaeella sp. TaxID=2605943 RepID=UPI003CCBB49E
MLEELNLRSREILRLVVEGYVETGEPVGSRTLSRKMEQNISPATIRNVMADLEDAGLLYAPHTSAGRLPTEMGLRLFVDGLLQVGNLSADERTQIEAQCESSGKSVTQVLEEASGMMSGLSRMAGLVAAPTGNGRLRHIEFVSIGPGRALVVMVSEGGLVENRIVEMPAGVPASALIEAGNYLSSRIAGRTLDEAKKLIAEEIAANRAEVDELTGKVVEQGLATWANSVDGKGVLIVSGQANLLEDVSGLADLEHIRALFAALERKETLLNLVDAARAADGVQVFIGAQNELFTLSGCSVIIAPYKNSDQKIVGAIGVVGPTRMNYARIVPMVDYTAKVVSRMMG